MSADEIERLCEVMHDAYEKAAFGAGWQTQQASQKPWADVPEPNKVTMRAAVLALLIDLCPKCARWCDAGASRPRPCVEHYTGEPS